MNDFGTKELEIINAKNEAKWQADLQAYKTAAGILCDRDPESHGKVLNALAQTEKNLAELSRCRATAGSEYDFVKASIARRDKSRKV